MVTLPGAWCYRVSIGTGLPGVSMLWLGEVESLICIFYLSVAALQLVWAYPSLRYTSMLLGHEATNQPTNFPHTHREATILVNYAHNTWNSLHTFLIKQYHITQHLACPTQMIFTFWTQQILPCKTTKVTKRLTFACPTQTIFTFWTQLIPPRKMTQKKSQNCTKYCFC